MPDYREGPIVGGGSHVAQFHVLTPLEQQARVQESEAADLDNQARRFTLQDLVEKRQANIKAREAEQQTQAFLQDAFTKYKHDDGSPDYQTIKQKALEYNPAIGMKVASGIDGMLETAAKTHVSQLQADRAEVEAVIPYLRDVKTLDDLQAALPEVAKRNPHVAQVLQADPSQLPKIINAAMSDVEWTKKQEKIAGEWATNPQGAFLNEMALSRSQDDRDEAFSALRAHTSADVVQHWSQVLGQQWTPQTPTLAAQHAQTVQQRETAANTATDNARQDAALKETIRYHNAEIANQQGVGAGGQGVVAAGPVDPNAPHGEDYLKTVAPDRAAVIKSLAEGRQPWPSSMAMKTDYWQQLANDVFKYDPTFDTATASNNARVKVRTDFTSGKSSDTIRALNQAMGHINQLDQLTDALKNTNVKKYNEIANSLLSNFTGWTGQNDYNTVVGHVAEELTKIWRGTGGNAEDIRREIETLDSNKPPGVLHSAIKNLVGLVESAQESLKEKQQQGMGTSANIPTASPEAQAIIDRIQGRSGSTGGTVTVGGVELTKQPDGKFKSASGAIYELRDGKYTRIK